MSTQGSPLCSPSVSQIWSDEAATTTFVIKAAFGLRGKRANSQSSLPSLSIRLPTIAFTLCPGDRK